MNVGELYLRFVQKVNQNLNSNNVTADRLRTVLLYNDAQVRYIEQQAAKANDERAREVQEFLIRNKELVKDSSTWDGVNYTLPSDYLVFSNATAICSKDKCENKVVYLHEIKDKNYNPHLQDEYNAPSFKHREAPFTISDNKVNIFTKDFNVDILYLSYYKKPKDIDIEGYVKNGKPSTNIDPEGSDRVINKIINLAALDYARNYMNAEQINITKDRINED